MDHGTDCFNKQFYTTWRLFLCGGMRSNITQYKYSCHVDETMTIYMIYVCKYNQHTRSIYLHILLYVMYIYHVKLFSITISFTVIHHIITTMHSHWLFFVAHQTNNVVERCVYCDLDRYKRWNFVNIFYYYIYMNYIYFLFFENIGIRCFNFIEKKTNTASRQ